MLIRPHLLTAVLLAGAARMLHAQAHRVELTPIISFVEPGAIYDKTTTFPELASSAVERLKVSGATAFGARLGYHVTPRWTVRAEASHASSSYVYRYDSRAVQEERRGNGAVTTLQASAARALVHTANGTRVEASLVGGVQRLSVQQSPPCGPPAMSQPPCLFSAEDWQRTYTVPFGGVAVGTSHPISARLAGDARVSYTLGRANTEAFWVDLLPQYDAYEADRHHWLRTVSATLGLTIGL